MWGDAKDIDVKVSLKEKNNYLLTKEIDVSDGRYMKRDVLFHVKTHHSYDDSLEFYFTHLVSKNKFVKRVLIWMCR